MSHRAFEWLRLHFQVCLCLVSLVLSQNVSNLSLPTKKKEGRNLLGYFLISFYTVQMDFLNIVFLFLQTVPSLNHQWCDQLDQIKWSTGCKAQVNDNREPWHIILFHQFMEGQKNGTLYFLHQPKYYFKSKKY